MVNTSYGAAPEVALPTSANGCVNSVTKKQVSFRGIIDTKDLEDSTNKGRHNNGSFRNGGQSIPPARTATATTSTTNGSTRSESSWESSGGTSQVSVASSSTSGNVSIPSLGSRLMRIQKHRDPLRYYEVVKLLGDGSMGSVMRVRKCTFGGSARKSFVENEQKAKYKMLLPECCFNLFCFPGIKTSSNSNFEKDLFLETDDTTTEVDPSPSESSSSFTSSDKKFDIIKRNKQKKRQKQYESRKNSSSMISFGSDVKVDFALKSIILDQCQNAVFRRELLNEIDTLRSLDHPNIVRAIETYDYMDKMYLVLELCDGGDLYKRDPYTESEAKSIAYSLLDAVAYLHSKNITHRDLKYENIMFASPTSSTVKIIDFGLSKKYGTDATMNETVGTIYTMAPEVLKREQYNEKCDIWSLGVLTFMLLSSSIPFYGKTKKDIVHKILSGTWSFHGKEWKRIPNQQAKDCITQMLIQDYKERPSATQIMEHVWFHHNKQDDVHDEKNEYDDDDMAIISTSVLDRVQAAMETFATYSRLKKLALLVIAHQSIDEEIGYLRRLFLHKFDTDKSSANFAYPEFKSALLQTYNYSDEELVDMFTGMDVDGTGKVSFTEFLAATIESHGSIEEERVAEAFDRIDCDDSGYITVENLKDILGDEVAEDFIDDIINEIKDGGGDQKHHITYEDFLGLWDSTDDEKLKQALLDVQQRRLQREASSASASLHVTSLSYSSDDGDNNDAALSMEQTGYDGDFSETADGHSFFGKEKAKSMRGAWI